jgi:hypothetical protein
MVGLALDRQQSPCIQASQPHDTSDRNPFCHDPNPLTPLAPGKIIDTLALRHCGPDGYVASPFIRLDAGRVWRWLNFQGGDAAETCLLLHAGWAALLAAGTAIVLVLGLYLWRRVPRHPSQNGLARHP